MRFYSWLLALSMTLIPASSWAGNILKKIEVNGSLIHFSFDREITQSQVEVDFGEHDIQLTFDQTLVHPAKNIPVKHGPVSQVFAYQHSPRAVRCRLNLNGNGGEYKDRVEVKALGRRLEFRLLEFPTTPPATHDATALHSSVGTSDSLQHETVTNPQVTASPQEKILPDEEKLLEQKILRSQEKPKVLAQALSDQKNQEEFQQTIRPLPSMGAVLMKLFFVTLLVVAFAGILKVLKSSSLKLNSPWLKSLQGLSHLHLGQGSSSIQVLHSHFIGPKKSLVTVKVPGQTLLLGVTDHSIQVLTRLDSVASSEEGSVQSESSFEEALSSESESGIRSRIRSRLEGLKPL